MRILEIIASVDPTTGGPVEALIRQEEATRGEAVREVVTLDPPDAPFLQGFPMTVHALGHRPRGGVWAWLDHYGYSAGFIPWLRANAEAYDAIIVHGLWNYASSGASIALKACRTPYFVFTHGMLDPWFRQRYPLKHLAKQVFWLAFEGALLRGARSVFFTCEEERRVARGVFLGYARYTETVVGYGAAEPPPPDAAQRQAFNAAVPALRDRRFLLFLGRLHPKKGCDLLIDAFAAVAQDDPGLDLVIVGPDPLAWGKALEAQAGRLGLGQRVHFPGGLFGDAKWGALRAAEVFVLPSHQENFGIVVAEALGCGTPVLISDRVNIWREIEAVGAGLAASDDARGTEDLLRRWLAMSDATRSAMRDAARALFESRFNVRRTAPALLEIIRSQVGA